MLPISINALLSTESLIAHVWYLFRLPLPRTDMIYNLNSHPAGFCNIKAIPSSC